MDDDNIAANAEKNIFSGNDVVMKKIKQGAKYCAGIVITIAFLVLTGWQFDIEFLKRLIPQLVVMNPVTAISFIFCSLSLLLLTTKTRSPQKILYGKILACLVLLTGLLQFVSTISGLNIRVDTILFKDKLIEDISGKISNRMAPNTAVCFILSGIALYLLNTTVGNQCRKNSIYDFLLPDPEYNMNEFNRLINEFARKSLGGKSATKLISFTI